MVLPVDDPRNHKVIIIHESSIDGMAASKIAEAYHLQKDNTKRVFCLDITEFRSYGHGCYDRFTDVVVLCTLTPAELQTIQNGAESLTWIDHNPESIHLMTSISGLRSSEHCTTYLTWLVYHSNDTKRTMPNWVRLVDKYERDENPDLQNPPPHVLFHHGLLTRGIHDTHAPIWDVLIFAFYDEMIPYGQLLNEGRRAFDINIKQDTSSDKLIIH